MRGIHLPGQKEWNLNCNVGYETASLFECVHTPYSFLSIHQFSLLP